jgi:TatD DNase family protein
MYIDSHCHIDCIDLAENHQDDINNLIQEARDALVSHMLCVCIELKDLPAIKSIADRFENISYSVGVHPNVELEKEPQDSFFIRECHNKKCIAIGETGLDYFRSSGDLDWQRQRFRQHIRLANQLNKPLIVHMRDASEDTINILIEEKAKAGVMHCFAEDWAVAKRCLDLGLYLSFSGIVSFKNARDLHEVAKKVPKDRFLIETDSPYLAPVPFRGKQNRPAWVVHVAQAVADLRGDSIETVAKLSTENFNRLFFSNIKSVV